VVLGIADVVAAAERLAGRVERTPVIADPALDAAVGAELHLKAESLQVTGSFKFRGASNAIAVLGDEQRLAGVVTYSSGNHGRAVAEAAALMGSSAVVVMPDDAPREKVAGVSDAGARIVIYDRYTEDRVGIAAARAADEGRVVVPPYDDLAVMAGQGTVALELLDQVDGLDAIVVPVGGGGLLAGCATVVHALLPAAEIFGVEPAAGDDHRRSRQAGHRVTIDVPQTIADGQQLATPGELTWPITNRLTTEFVTVSDTEIVAAMQLLQQRIGLVVEPSGASALAAVALGGLGAGLAGKRVGVLLSGGNIGGDRFHGLTGL
jgi:threonine dehydratase